MEKLLNDDVTQQVREVFKDLSQPVQLMLFISNEKCEYCTETRQLAEEVAAISDLIDIDIYDVHADADLAKKYNVDNAPGMVIAAKEGKQITDFGVRLMGIPSGHEFTSLIQDIILVSNRDSGLSSQTRSFLKKLDQPILLQVFVTPTCPYCPQAVVLAHKMAMENPMIQAEMVEATEFPELASRHGVSGVPQTTINAGKAHVVGAVPEQNLLAEIQRILGD